MTARATMREVTHLGHLTPDGRNARRHNPRNVGLIEDALREVGAARSIVIDEAGVVLAGNATVEAAAAAGIERVQVVEADGETIIAVRRTGLTEHQKRRLALYDNRAAELADWDAGMLAGMLDEDARALAGLFTDDELDALLADLAAPEPAADPGADVDRADELRLKWQTAPGQIWVAGRHRIMCGDSTNAEDVARLMGGERADMLWTDPPYGVQYQGKGGDAIAGDITYTAIPLMFAMLPGILADGAWFYICGGANNASLYARMIEHYFRMTPRVVVWDKCGTIMRHNSYHSAYEFIYFGFLEGGGARWYGSRAGEEATDIWRVPKPTSAAREHLTEKPSELPKRAIANSCKPNGLVVDLFLGSGSAMVAAEQTGRTCYAMELDPRHIAVTLERLAGMGLAPTLQESYNSEVIDAALHR